MKTAKYTLTVAAALAALLPALPAASQTRSGINVDARVEIRPRPVEDLQVWIWPDRGEGADYFPGENIYMNVEVTRDCFLILYDIDTRGNLRILFPYDPWDDNFVAAGDVVRFPRPWDGYDWTVDGPAGIEYVQAIASEFPIAAPDWPVYLRSGDHDGSVYYDSDLRDFRAGDDRLGYIRVVNKKITGRYWDWCATDIASFYVRGRYHHRIYSYYDPWPETFYGEIYIGWPIGGRIYIDDVFIGIAPIWVPRHVRHGRHVIVCYDNDRIVRRQSVDFYAKKDYRHDGIRYRDGEVRTFGSVKKARRGGAEEFGREAKVYGNDKQVRERRNDAPVKLRSNDKTRRTESSDVIKDSQSAGKIRRETSKEKPHSGTSGVVLKPKPKESNERGSAVKQNGRSDHSSPAVSEAKSSKKKSVDLKSLVAAISKSGDDKASSKRESVKAAKSSSKSDGEVKSKKSDGESKKAAAKKESKAGRKKR